jgi:hypothetical protein
LFPPEVAAKRTPLGTLTRQQSCQLLDPKLLSRTNYEMYISIIYKLLIVKAAQMHRAQKQQQRDQLKGYWSK